MKLFKQVPQRTHYIIILPHNLIREFKLEHLYNKHMVLTLIVRVKNIPFFEIPV